MNFQQVEEEVESWNSFTSLRAEVQPAKACPAQKLKKEEKIKGRQES